MAVKAPPVPIRAKKNIADLSVTERIELAKQKTKRIVDHTIDLIALHEANRIVVYSPQLSKQIPQSFAANAFNGLQLSLYSFALVRLCALWDERNPVDLDMESIPTVVSLIEAPDVLDTLQAEVRQRHSTPPTIFGLENESPEMKAWVEQEAQASAEADAQRDSEKARAGLESAIQWTGSIGKSDKLRAIRNHRDKHLAHSLTETHREKRGPVPPAKYGYERRILGKTIVIVNRLYLGINDVGFSWTESFRIARKNAEALWNGCTFKVLE